MSYQPDDDRSFARSGYTSGHGRTQGRTRYRQRQTYVLPRPSRVRSSDHRFHPGAWAVFLIVLALTGLVGYWFYSYAYGSEHHETLTVTRLDDQSNGSSGHKYLIFARTPDGQVKVYEDTDSLSHFKFNSSDLFAQLQVGSTYDCDLYGVRSHLFSAYQDLLSCTRVG